MNKVLIVDDESVNRKLTISYLLELGYTKELLLEASDGEEALDLIYKYKNEIDYILLDIYMPNKSGEEVIETIKNDESLENIPIIVLTTDDGLKNKLKNVNVVMVRPVSFNDFVLQISKYVNTK